VQVGRFDEANVLRPCLGDQQQETPYLSPHSVLGQWNKGDSERYLLP
jgi:hypothetical protein